MTAPTHNPTPTIRLASLETGLGSLWMKDDGRLGVRYGGNKVRKLAVLLDGARDRGIRRVLTVGAAGSHHVLATTLCAAELGIDVSAVMVSQPHTPHAENVLRCSFGYGAHLLTLGSLGDIKTALGMLLARDVMWLGPGAMGILGSSSYMRAAHELLHQIKEGALPAPHTIVVALGSGSTAAGLLVGLEQTGSNMQLLAVPAAPGRWSRTSVLAQAWRLARHCQVNTSWQRLAARLRVDLSETGSGYGVPTSSGARAAELGQSVGVTLEPTYTAKAFAVAVKHAAQHSGAVLYWHTLSSHAMPALLRDAPANTELSPKLKQLLRQKLTWSMK